jgi:hypothetical protein
VGPRTGLGDVERTEILPLPGLGLRLRLLVRPASRYVWVLIKSLAFSISHFLFAAQPKEFFLEGLQKLEQRSHKRVELRGECRVNTFFHSCSLLFSL